MGHERRRLVISSDHQKRIVFAIAWWPSATLCTLALFLGYYSKQLHDEALLVDADLGSIVPVLLLCAGLLMATIGITVFRSLQVSLRIVGPVMSLRRTFAGFKAGDRSARVTLRKQDLVHELADEVNQLLDWVAEQLPAADPAEVAEPAGEATGPGPVDAPVDAVDAPATGRTPVGVARDA